MSSFSNSSVFSQPRRAPISNQSQGQAKFAMAACRQIESKIRGSEELRDTRAGGVSVVIM